MIIEQQPAVIIGSADSVFAQNLARAWRTRGLDVIIVTSRWAKEPVLEDGIRIFVPPRQRGMRLLRQRTIQVIGRTIKVINKTLENSRYQRTLTLWEEKHHPVLDGPLNYALSMAPLIREINPRFVFGQEVYLHGLATAFCSGRPRILMPWGGDIYLMGRALTTLHHLVRYGLQHVELVCPTSASAVPVLRDEYGVSSERIQAISWGVDRQMFHPVANPATRSALLARYNIPENATTVLNVRRFRPAWGSEIALEAFSRFAHQNSNTHFILLGGSGTTQETEKARHRLEVEGLLPRFTIFTEDIPLQEVADLMSISDIFTSLMIVPDMRSASILQAAACGAIPILSDQIEYHYLLKNGFQAEIVPSHNADAVVAALSSLTSDTARFTAMRAANIDYISRHEDSEVQMDRLLSAVMSIRVNTQHNSPHLPQQKNSAPTNKER